jgi:hypothetical protein
VWYKLRLRKRDAAHGDLPLGNDSGLAAMR